MNDDLQSLQDEIEDRINMAREAIAEAGLTGDWSHAQAVAGAVKNLKASLQRLTEVRKDLRRAMLSFDQLTKSNTKAAHTRLLVRLDWRAAGCDRSSVLVDEPTGAEALAKFLEELVEVRGVDILPHIQRIPCGGSGLVSRNPRLDFINPATGEEYGNRPISTTGWHVKTHTSTRDKAEQIHQIKTLMGFPRHAIEVDVLEK